MTKISAQALVQVPFYDVDMMRIAWHGNYLKYFEEGRCALLDKLDYNYRQMEASGYMWPIVDCRIKYVRPARYQNTLCVRATLTEYEHRLRMEYLITDHATGTKLTTGYSVQVAVDIASGEMCYASPSILLEKVRSCVA